MELGEAQAMMRHIYFHKDSKRGPKKTWQWLMEEVKELGEAIEAGDKRAMEAEFADVLAWLASLANVVGIDLERAFLTKYPGRCPKCGRAVCMCATS